MSNHHANPHQPWCDLNTCTIDTDLSTTHFGRQITHVIGDRGATSLLYRSSDGKGTAAFIDLHGDDPYTPDELEKLASIFQDLATQIRE